MPEALLITLALAAYALAGTAVCARGAGAPPRWERLVALGLAGALVLHTLALAWRWRTLGHGPFTTMHEILSSNLWSLTLVFGLAWVALREVRASAIVVVPVLATLAVWMAVTDAGAGHFPATYATPLLYLHTLVGKLFLGLLLVAVALAVRPALRRQGGVMWGRAPGGASSKASSKASGIASPQRFDALAHRFAAFAFVSQTLMLIVGAVWAQDAWGRYWAWDPLESWAFVTWLALGATLHARVAFRLSPRAHAACLVGVFVLAFLTFFGVPFISVAPHKGAV